jgi:repressor LexA
MNGLTDRQRHVLGFIEEYTCGHGYPPTIREIRSAFGFRSNRGVVDHLRALERKGYIRRTPGSSRAIEIVMPTGEHGAPVGHVRAYPVAGRIAAGSPEAPFELHDESFLLDERLFAERGDFILEVKGESMMDEHIMPGDLVVVRKSETCEPGSVVVAIVDGEATVKRYARRGRQVVLEPANPAYEPIVLSEDTGPRASIVGLIVGVIRRFPKRRRGFSR